VSFGQDQPTSKPAKRTFVFQPILDCPLYGFFQSALLLVSHFWPKTIYSSAAFDLFNSNAKDNRLSVRKDTQSEGPSATVGSQVRELEPAF